MGRGKNKRSRGEESQNLSPPRVDHKKVKIQSTTDIQNGQEEAQTTTMKAVKPITAMAGIARIKEVCKSLKVANITYKVINNESTQIFCGDLKSKQIIIQAFKEKLINHFTYTEPAEKPSCFVLKGFYDINPDELLKLLVTSGVPAIKASVLFKSKGQCLYLISFNKSTMSCNRLNESHRLIDDIIVKWDVVKSKSKAPLQCHRCQRWGHSAANCGFQYRCVKCIMDHPIGECGRTTREGSAQCCNCRGDHAANHRGCEAFKAYEKRMLNQKSAKTKATTMVQQRLQGAEFPALRKSTQAVPAVPIIETHCEIVTPTYAQQLKSQPQVSASHIPKSQSLADSLSDLTGQLVGIPNLHSILSIFQVLIDQLKLISMEMSRASQTVPPSSSPNSQSPDDGL